MVIGRGAGHVQMPPGPCGCFLGGEGGDSLWRAEGVAPTWQFVFRDESPSACWEGKLLGAK